MKSLTKAALIAATSMGAAAQVVERPPPVDRPTSFTREQLETYDKQIAPLVDQARATYPEAKARFLAGLPKGQQFFVVTRIYDNRGKFEQVFVAVSAIRGSTVHGHIASSIRRVVGFRAGQPYMFPEFQMVDWAILHPDGREEGNVVGKFMDTYKVSE